MIAKKSLSFSQNNCTEKLQSNYYVNNGYKLVIEIMFITGMFLVQGMY